MDLYQPIEPLSPRERFDTLQDVLAACSLAIGIPGIFLFLMAIGG